MSQAVLLNPIVSSAAVLSGVGNGTLVIDRLTHFTISQTYVVTCISSSPDHLFSVVGSLDGPVGIAQSGVQFFDEDLKVFFTITDGGTAFQVGDYFTFSVQNGTDLNQENIDLYDEVPQKNFGVGIAGLSRGDHNVRYSNTSLFASLTIQGLRLTAATAGSAGDSITLAFVDDGTAGSETVGVASSAITVHMEDGVSTLTQIKATLDASSPATALVIASLIGAGASPVYAFSSISLYGGKNKSFALNHNEITDSGSFVEGNTNLKAKDATVAGNLSVTKHAHFSDAVSLGASSSGGAVSDVQKYINRLIAIGNIEINTSGQAFMNWSAPSLTCSSSIQIYFRASGALNTVSMASPISLSDGDSWYVILNPEQTTSIVSSVSSSIPSDVNAFRLATRVGTTLVFYNGSVIGTSENARIGNSGSTASNVGDAIVRRNSSGDFAARIITTQQVLVGPGTGNGLDVTSAGNLEIGQSVGANEIKIGVTASTTRIPGNLIVEGSTTTIDTTNTTIKDKLVTLNKGGASVSGDGTGIEVEENSAITGYEKVSSDRNSWTFKAPNSSGIASLTPGSSNDIIVLENATQTLTNKTFDDSTVHKQVGTPANPSSGYDRLYFKTDDRLYALDSLGNERPIGSAGGSVKVDLYDPLSTNLPSSNPTTTDGVVIANNFLVLFDNLSSNSHRVYKATVSGPSITWVVQSLFSEGLDPVQGDEIRVKSGTAFNGAFGYYDETDSVFKFNDFVRYYDGTDYWEQSSLKTLAMVNNTTDEIISVAYSGSENMIIDFSIQRGTAKETGTMLITTDGTSVDVTTGTAFLGSAGVSFSGIISGSNIIIYYTTDNLGSAGILKYFVKRWSNNAGGPGGIPNYSTSPISSGGAAGSNKEIQFNSSGVLGASSSLTYDSSTKVLQNNGLEQVGLSSGIALADNTVSPTTAFSYSASIYPFAIIEFSITRGSNLTTGRIMVASDGSTASSTLENIKLGDDGVTLTILASAGTLSIQYISTSTGVAGTLKYSMRRWS